MGLALTTWTIRTCWFSHRCWLIWVIIPWGRWRWPWRSPLSALFWGRHGRGDIGSINRLNLCYYRFFTLLDAGLKILCRIYNLRALQHRNQSGRSYWSYVSGLGPAEDVMSVRKLKMYTSWFTQKKIDLILCNHSGRAYLFRTCFRLAVELTSSVYLLLSYGIAVELTNSVLLTFVVP